MVRNKATIIECEPSEEKTSQKKEKSGETKDIYLIISYPSKEKEKLDEFDFSESK